MKTKSKMSIKFYQRLGCLFYAIAAIDKTVRPEEIVRLRQCVTETWLSVDDLKDEFGEDAAYQIEIVFNWLESEVQDANENYDRFVDYYLNNPKAFTPEVKKIIQKTAGAIAASFSGVNKSELGLLAKLSLLLNE